MQILDLIQSFPQSWHCLLPTEAGSAISVVSLPFNPIKLVVLVGWVYLCLYFVQRVQFSPLVPKQYKSIAYIITLFVGPLLLLSLLIIDTFRKAFESDDSIFEVIRQQIQDAFNNMRSIAFRRKKEDSGIRLLDSSGTELKEIYGHGDGKREDSHVLELTEKIIADALEQRASDILIDPRDEATYTIRLRIDGVLRTVKELKTGTCKAIVNSIKAVSSMDISEKRRPQDGAFVAKKGEMTASFRVASAGVIYGEKLSVRVLNQNAGRYTLVDVGFTKKQFATIKSVISKPSGMILICGPTGSGKTTTMYAMLNEIDRFTRNVVTVEDPIEAVLPESSQIEINPKADITFAKALRSILRQDPDVICVGEIRDEETAEIALRAAQTGHLVLATIHCNSNAAALVRLMDLGISPLLLSSGLSALISQRLLRKLCIRCKRPVQLSQNQIHEFQRKHINCTSIFEATGCKRCGETGYFGRTAACDIVVITNQMKDAIVNNQTLITEMRAEGSKKGKSNLNKQGLKKVVSGITSLQELHRVIG